MSEGNYFTEEEKIERLESELALCRERLGPAGIKALTDRQKRIEELEERLFHETANRLAIESAFKESQSREVELQEYKELHHRCVALVFPGERDSSDAYMKILRDTERALKESQAREVMLQDEIKQLKEKYEIC